MREQAITKHTARQAASAEGHIVWPDDASGTGLPGAIPLKPLQGRRA
jgi:hypothetical protein